MGRHAGTVSNTPRPVAISGWFPALWLVLAGALAGGAQAVEPAPLQARALLLYSHHPGFESAADMQREVRSALARHGVQLDVDYMDDRRLHDPASASHLRRQIAHPVSGKPAYGVILLGDDSAVRFALRNHALFRGRPLVRLAAETVRSSRDLDAMGGVVAGFFAPERHTALAAQ